MLDVHKRAQLLEGYAASKSLPIFSTSPEYKLIYGHGTIFQEVSSVFAILRLDIVVSVQLQVPDIVRASRELIMHVHKKNSKNRCVMICSSKIWLNLLLNLFFPQTGIPVVLYYP